MIAILAEEPATGLCWTDVVDPTPAELAEVALRWGLHEQAVRDCLDPEHLPKLERFEGVQFLMVRAFDEKAANHAEDLRSITRKIACFVGDRFLVTVHRKDQPYIGAVRDRWAGRLTSAPHASPLEVVVDLMREAFLTFERPLDDAFDAFERFEDRLFAKVEGAPLVQEIYYLKRRVATIRRMLHLAADLVPRLVVTQPAHSPMVQDLREEAQAMCFYADDLAENLNNLLTLYLTLASHRTNEVMRLLTLLSVFFLPLTFIVGVYGMNFSHMPELALSWGYPAVWGVMLTVAALIGWWARRRGWL